MVRSLRDSTEAEGPDNGEHGVGRFGPAYPKINSLWKRDERNVVVPGEWSCPEFEFLSSVPWRWTEKVDGTNIRVHWDGEAVTLGGRTDNAQVPATLVANLAFLNDPDLWRSAFPDADDVTVYGEGYGAKIQSGGQYRPDQSLVVFDVLVGPWWLNEHAVEDVAGKLGLDVVPEVGRFDLVTAWERTTLGDYRSQWPDARIEGLVGRPVVDLSNRRGERIMAKAKVKDWQQFDRKRNA